MKYGKLTCIVMLTGLCLASWARAESQQVSVSFASVKALRAKNGASLDGSVTFVFADGKTSVKSARVFHAYGSTSSASQDKTVPCRLALLRAFLSLQKQAKSAGLTHVVGITTASRLHDLAASSKSGEHCLCSVSGSRVVSFVQGTPAP